MMIQKRDVPITEIRAAIAKYNNTSEDKFGGLVDMKLKYKSKRYILGGGKIYLSRADYLKGISVPTVDDYSIADLQNQDFLNECAHFMLFVD